MSHARELPGKLGLWSPAHGCHRVGTVLAACGGLFHLEQGVAGSNGMKDKGKGRGSMLGQEGTGRACV